MRVRRFATQLGRYLVGALLLTSVPHSRALAQGHDRQTMTSQQQPQTAEQKKEMTFDGQNQ